MALKWSMGMLVSGAGTVAAGWLLAPWGVALFETVQPLEPAEGRAQSAYDRWLDQTSAREQARNERVHAWTKAFAPE